MVGLYEEGIVHNKENFLFSKTHKKTNIKVAFYIFLCSFSFLLITFHISFSNNVGQHESNLRMEDALNNEFEVHVYELQAVFACPCEFSLESACYIRKTIWSRNDSSCPLQESS